MVFPYKPLSTDDPLFILMNPESFTIQVFYTYFFPYDWVKYEFGNHVSDIEHTYIIYEKTLPTEVYVSQHSWGESIAWGAGGL